MQVFKGALGGAVLLLALGEASGQQPLATISIEENVLPREDVLKVVEIFKRNCAPLNQYWVDIQTINVEVRKEYAEFRLDKGWKASIHLTVKVPDNPRIIPKVDKRVGVIAGHTLHYHLGGGSDPGMFGAKRVSQMLCGMPMTDRGADTFKSMPELSFLRY